MTILSLPNLLIPITTLVFMVTISSAQPSSEKTESDNKVPNDAQDICPILTGQSLPKTTLKTADNKSFDLNAAVAETPTILIFYRGGWCLYCNIQLAQLQEIESELVQLGFQIIAVSPDRPKILKTHAEKKGLKYRLLSDSDMAAAKALGIAYKVDETIITKYKKYDMDLESDSGQKHHLLPVPAVFVIGTDGVIQFSYVNPNYKVRIDPGLLVEAAKAAIK